MIFQVAYIESVTVAFPDLEIRLKLPGELSAEAQPRGLGQFAAVQPRLLPYLFFIQIIFPGRVLAKGLGDAAWVVTRLIFLGR